jgi:hypothetical protein
MTDYDPYSTWLEDVISIRNCASCGEDHMGLDLHLVGDSGPGELSEYPWYTNCPNTGERIYVK